MLLYQLKTVAANLTITRETVYKYETVHKITELYTKWSASVPT
jgi:predicted transcriptional regulator